MAPTSGLEIPAQEEMEHHDPTELTAAEAAEPPSDRCVTHLQHAQYQLAFRLLEEITINPLHFQCKLFQQLVIDTFISVEAERLKFHRINQRTYRVERMTSLIKYLQDYATQHGLKPKPGYPVILPASFVGGPRFKIECFRDAMAIVRERGAPDYFLTITCNPRWPAIQNALNGYHPSDRPDIVDRVFSLVVKELKRDLLQRRVLGEVEALIYAIEFQKRGLPHAHMLIIVGEEDKPRHPAVIDQVVCAELPNESDDPELRELVGRHMLHDCGDYCKKRNGPGCKRHFPMEYRNETDADGNGYPLYRRRNDAVHNQKFKKGPRVYSNQDVVPYNAFFLKKYTCHLNLEVCTSIRSVKYIYKYIFKGPDKAIIKIDQRTNEASYDEISHYVETRFIGSTEAMWRLLELPVHFRSVPVIKLPFHLEGEQWVRFEESSANNVAVTVAMNADNNTQQTAWFELNKTDLFAREFVYADIPKHYVYKKGKWTRRKTGVRPVVRLPFVFPSAGDAFYLRMVLHHARGATCFTELRTVDGVVYSNFEQVARALGLCKDDDEWHKCMQEASLHSMPCQLRALFVVILMQCDNVNAHALWVAHKEKMAEDYTHQHGDSTLGEDHALHAIADLLVRQNKTLDHYKLPHPTGTWDVVHETTFQVTEEEEAQLWASLNVGQRAAAETIWQAVEANKGGLYFLNGVGGTGKTYVYKTICARMFLRQMPFACSAPTGIAALLLPEGRTLHSQFGLSIDLSSGSKISPASVDGKRLRAARLIVVDEASMLHKDLISAVDALLKDIMRESSQQFFGGKVVVFGGDFRQILPIVVGKGMASSAAVSIKRTAFWQQVITLPLEENMRARDAGPDFINWLLRVGNGVDKRGQPAELAFIPASLMCTGSMAEEIYGTTLTAEEVQRESGRRVILTPLNDTCLRVNEHIVSNVLQGELHEYFSVDGPLENIEPLEARPAESISEFDLAFINKITPPGMPPHNLRLKRGTVCYICRNINLPKTLANGRRVMVVNMMANCVAVQLLDAPRQGEIEFLPRIDFLVQGEPRTPFAFRRRQFPLVLAFAMTINKAQGQTFDKVGLFLPDPVFSHGHLYVALSRARGPHGLRVQVKNPIAEKHYLVEEGLDCGAAYTLNPVHYPILR